jgi:hypothetical protein
VQRRIERAWACDENKKREDGEVSRKLERSIKKREGERGRKSTSKEGR